MELDFARQDLAVRILIVAALAVGAHVAVRVIRYLVDHVRRAEIGRTTAKARTVAGLVSSILIFTAWASALGFALVELGVSIQTYLASVSLIGLALAFGSQGLVQDVVTGLTMVFGGLFDEGDMVELGGQTGIVQRLGMRFTVLVNALGAEVFIPNRSIGNVVIYPRGYVRCIADVTLAAEPEAARRMEDAVRGIVAAFAEQFPGILRTPPDYEGIQSTGAGRTYLRVKFRIWPGRGGPVETAFRPEVVQALKAVDPAYSDWMVAVGYEVERKSAVALTRFSGRGRAAPPET